MSTPAAVFVAAMLCTGALSLLSFVGSLTRHNQGLNFLVNGNRLAGVSRFCAGLAFFAMFGLCVTVSVEQASFRLVDLMLFPFLLIAGGYLVSAGRRITDNFPR